MNSIISSSAHIQHLYTCGVIISVVGIIASVATICYLAVNVFKSIRLQSSITSENHRTIRTSINIVSNIIKSTALFLLASIASILLGCGMCELTVAISTSSMTPPAFMIISSLLLLLLIINSMDTIDEERRHYRALAAHRYMPFAGPTVPPIEETQAPTGPRFTQPGLIFPPLPRTSISNVMAEERRQLEMAISLSLGQNIDTQPFIPAASSSLNGTSFLTTIPEIDDEEDTLSSLSEELSDTDTPIVLVHKSAPIPPIVDPAHTTSVITASTTQSQPAS